MSHNERGLRIDGAPVKRHIVRVELDVEVTGAHNATQARMESEEKVTYAMRYQSQQYPGGPRLLGRPNAKRAQLAPDES